MEKVVFIPKKFNLKMSLTLLIFRVRGCHIDFIYTVFHVESEYSIIFNVASILRKIFKS